MLTKYSFNATYNPIGTVYNPSTLAKIIHQSIYNKSIQADTLNQNKDVFCHFDYHSKYNSLLKKEVVKSINADLRALAIKLKSCDFIFLTLGTAIVHVEAKSGSIVGNCHKLPASYFSKRILKVAEIKTLLKEVIKVLQEVNKNAKIIFTISPVRHTKEGLVENAKSKSRLLAAVSELQERYEIGYFPSYEIMHDELRDYRYYKSDLIHPSKTAIKHIWEIFGTHYFSEQTLELNKKLKRILVSAKHKAFHPKSSEHQAFLKTLLAKIEDLESQEEHIELSKVKKKVSKQLMS